MMEEIDIPFYLTMRKPEKVYKTTVTFNNR